MERSVIMCPVNWKGGPSMCMLHICVNNTWRPSPSDTAGGVVVTLLLITEVPSIPNICIVPEYVIVLPVLRGKLAPAKLLEVKK
jgi:hypothetical protein